MPLWCMLHVFIWMLCFYATLHVFMVTCTIFIPLFLITWINWTVRWVTRWATGAAVPHRRSCGKGSVWKQSSRRERGQRVGSPGSPQPSDQGVAVGIYAADSVRQHRLTQAWVGSWSSAAQTNCEYPLAYLGCGHTEADQEGPQLEAVVAKLGVGSTLEPWCLCSSTNLTGLESPGSVGDVLESQWSTRGQGRGHTRGIAGLNLDFLLDFNPAVLVII